MMQPGKTHRVAALLALCSSVAMSAYGRTLHPFTGQNGETMSFLAWIVLGLVSGFIASKLVNRRGEGIVLDVLLGVVGAFVGGWLFRLFGANGVSGLNLYSIFVAIVGSVVLLVLYHAVRRRRTWYRSL
jgi:uncharacterized membrane protein YeaQ/YmgE (transglycosylase-associated protein family)